MSAHGDLVIFMDESGNTGSNITDASQPYFVLSAFAFRAEVEEDVATIAQRIRDELNVAELKFSTVKGHRNFPKFESLMSALLKKSVHLSYSIIEKDYFGGMLLVEYLLDSWHNDHVPNTFFQSGSAKQAAAERLCAAFPAQLRQDFIYALESGDSESLLSSKQAIVDEIRRSKLNDAIYKWIVSFEDEKFLECCTGESPHFKTHCGANFHAFSMMVQCLIRLFVGNDFKRGRLLSDAQHQYQSAFQWIAEAFKSNDLRTIYDPEGRSLSVGPFFDDAVSFLDSKGSPGIQCADLAASSCAWLLKQNADGAIPDHAKQYYRRLAYHLLRSVGRGYSYYAIK